MWVQVPPVVQMITPITILQSFFATVGIIALVLGVRILGLLAMRAHGIEGEDNED